jgi:hypothetical protein
MDESTKVQVEQWGYRCGSEQEIAGLVWPVRFKPAMTLVLVLIGLIFRSEWLLIGVGALGIAGTFFQRISWIDLLYNHVARKPFGAPALGPDPSMRRWLCGMADAFVLASGIALAAGRVAAAWIFGGMVTVLAGSVVLTGVCLPAYLIYRRRSRA